MTNHPNRSKQIVKGRARNSFPGDEVYVMTREHVDILDRTWEAGTEYTPISTGFNNLRDCAEQVVSIDGKSYTFA